MSRRAKHELDPSIEESEWPPSRYVLHVFSSKTGRWEERPFVRNGRAMGTVRDMRKAFLFYVKRYAAYWQGELYVHCEANFVMRYLAVEASTRPEALHLGKSEKGVYCALVDESNQTWQIRVWTLKKLCDQMEWVLMHQANLGSLLARQDYDYQIDGPWILSDINYRRRCGKGGETVVQERLEWDSDNDYVVQAEDRVAEEEDYKEVVFLSESSTIEWLII
ncbi:hypothetical protein C2845_PM02G03160 [Panicum miliaceum]|uniref:Uncharacterized protein n=1 Tax=Panicum miliaceum TaxID=4540 RepID=A0A3L6S9W2_PANMI|nr:hypothetical protein C2845_PM02G03160 [Panicum miliaceum]